MQQEPLLRLLADTLDLPQGGVDLGLAAEVAMEGDTETVRLVADLLQDFQRLGVAIDEKGIGIAHPDDLLQPLGQADDRQLLGQAQFRQRLVRKIQLALAAVDDNQLRQIVRILSQHPAVAPVDDLLHRSVVVRPDDGLDLEPAVIFLGRLPVAEHHAGSDRIGTLDVGVVEALHMPGEFLHPDGLLQVFHHLEVELVRIGMLALLQGIELLLLGIARPKLEQGELVPLDRDAEFNTVQLHIRQEGHEDLLGQGAELGFDFRDEGTEDGGRLLFDLKFEAQAQALHDGSAAQAHEMTEGLGRIRDQGEHIDIPDGRAADDGLAVMFLQRGHLLLAGCRLLEIQGFGRGFHPVPVMLDHFPAAALEQGNDFLDPAIVFFPGHRPDAAALAPPDVVFQAGTELVPQDGLGIDFQVAGPQGVELPEKVQEVARMKHAAIRAEIPRTVLDQTAGHIDLREFVGAYADPGIGLRILQEDVVPGLVLLDEVVLQQQGVRLRTDDRELGIGNLRNEDAGLAVEPLGRDEILGNTLVQVFRLAHIDDIPLGVIVTIDTGGMRK